MTLNLSAKYLVCHLIMGTFHVRQLETCVEGQTGSTCLRQDWPHVGKSANKKHIQVGYIILFTLFTVETGLFVFAHRKCRLAASASPTGSSL